VIRFYSILIRGCYCSAFLLVLEIMKRDCIHSYGLRTTAYACGSCFDGHNNFVVAVLDSKVIDHAYEAVACCEWYLLGDFQYGFSFHSESSYGELAFLLGSIFSY
jgi:hypothetical protein